MAHLYIRTKVGGDNEGPKQTICCPVFFFTVVALLLYSLTLGNFRNTGSRGATVQANLCQKASYQGNNFIRTKVTMIKVPLLNSEVQ